MELEKEITPEQEDVRYLQEQLESTHFDLYRNVDKETLAESLSHATEVDPEYYKIALQESLALIRDAHTYVPGIFNGEQPLLVCREIEGKIYITGTRQENESLLWNELKEVNGYPIEQVMSKIAKLSSNESEEILLRDVPMFMTSPLALRYYGLDKGDEIEIETGEGNNETVKNNSSKIKKRNPLRWKKEEKEDPTFFGNSLYRARVIDDTLLFQYNGCTNEGHTEKELKDFKEKLLELANKAGSIVVDLRMNSGGYTKIMSDLFTKFPDDKKIYVAMRRKTFSSAIHHLLYLKKEKNAILIGENAGQKPNRFGDHKLIVLPNSKIRVHCSYKYFELLPGQDLEVIEPDIKIPVTIEDYKNDTDPLNKWIKNNL